MEGGRERVKGVVLARTDGGILGKDMYKRERKREREPNLCELRLRYLSGFL